jgi:hypothetical protein
MEHEPNHRLLRLFSPDNYTHIIHIYIYINQNKYIYIYLYIYIQFLFSLHGNSISAWFQSQRRRHKQIQFRKNLLSPHAFGRLLDPALQRLLSPATGLLWLKATLMTSNAKTI